MNSVKVFSFLLIAMSFVCTSCAKAQQPNIVLLIADDLGYSDIGCYGGKIDTPNIDRLASEGLRFTNFYAGAAVCSPSRAALLTGRSPIRSGVYDWVPADGPMHLPESEITLAEVLRDAGYATCHVGKWHLSRWSEQLMSGPTPGDQGFDDWFGCDNNARPSHLDPVNFMRNGKACGPMKGYSCQIFADDAIDWLENQRDKDKPFYLNLWFNEPHRKLASPPKLVAKYEDRGLNHNEAVYYANIENLDLAAGKVLRALKKNGLAENTLVLFSSDNGPWHTGSTGPLRGRKADMYEGGIRVPGIIRWPGHIKAGGTCDTPAGFVDMLPTVASLTGAKLPTDRTIDGTNIQPLLEGKDLKRENPLFWFFYKSSPICVVRQGDYLLAADPLMRHRSKWHPFDQEDFDYLRCVKMERFELYNLCTDIGQKNDLATAHPEKVNELKKILLSIHADIIAEGRDWKGLPAGKGGTMQPTGK